MLGRQAFAQWSSQDFPSDRAKLLWIYGQPGFGKTILCAYLVQRLSSIVDGPVAHHFFSSDHESRSDPGIAMRCWVSQLASHPDAFALARQRWEATEGHTAPQLTIVELLREILQAVPGCTLIVDGIDECTTLVGRNSSAARFLQDIDKAVQSTTRALIVSRDEVQIRQALRDGRFYTFIEYKISPQDVQDDTTAYSRHIVEKKLERKTEDVKSRLSETMSDRCGGQFLWLSLQGEQLKGWMNMKQLQRAVDAPSSGLDYIYERNWVRIEKSEQDRERAFDLLRWAVFALRPLTVGEMTEAVLVDDNCDGLLFDDLPDTIDDEFIDDQIIRICSPLLEARDPQAKCPVGRRTVHVTHFTVKQFLIPRLAPRELWANENLRVSHEQVQNTMLARLCLRYIRSWQVWQRQDSTSTQNATFHATFLSYAAASWHTHANSGIPLAEDTDTLKYVLEFMDEAHPCWNSWRVWFDAQNQEEVFTLDENKPQEPIYYAVKLGQTTVAVQQMQTRGYGKKESHSERDALHQACLDGNTAIVKAMLEADVSITTQSRRGATAFHMATYNGHLEVAKMLVDKGANIMLADNNGWTPVHLAADQGHLEMVKLLVDKGADIMQANNDGGTPVNIAASEGYLEVVELLVNKGADIMQANNNGWTPVHLAAYKGHLEVVKLLVDKGANIMQADNNGWTLVHLAAYNSHLELIKLLVDKGANITMARKDGSTLLHSASFKGGVGVVQLLLEVGADAATTDNLKRSPLVYAAKRGHNEVGELLLAASPSMAAFGDWLGSTPLFAAVRNGHCIMAQTLLSLNPLALHDRDFYGHTVLWWALRNGDAPMTELLFDAAKMAGLDLRGEPSAKEKRPPKTTGEGAWCDACMLDIPKDNAYYACGSCGSTVFCLECFNMGITCTDSSHTLDCRVR